MRTFYFHLKHGEHLIADEEGVTLPDLAAARHEALQAAHDLADAIKTGNPNVADAIVVVDEDGRTVDSLRLAAVLPQPLRAMILPNS